jgi:hypothetical protein
MTSIMPGDPHSTNTPPAPQISRPENTSQMTDNENALVVSPSLHHAPTLFTPPPSAAKRLL